MGVDAEIFIKNRKPLSELKVRRLSAHICQTIGVENFYLKKDKNRHALEIIDRWEQIEPEGNEQFIRVHFSGRYYGPNYARGDWLVIRAIIRMLELLIEDSEVWYSGDSSGICAQQMTDLKMREFDRFFFVKGNIPYDSAFRDHSLHPKCLFCGDFEMSNAGGGKGKTFFECAGCGDRYIRRDSGALEKVETFS